MRPNAIVYAGSLLAVIGLAPSLALATEPWPGSRWRADVDEVRDGHHRHTTMIGLETNTAPGETIRVICSDTDLTTGTTVTGRALALGQTRQDDWEGDAGPLGSFGSHTGDTLRWFDPTPCAAGAMAWRRR